MMGKDNLRSYYECLEYLVNMKNCFNVSTNKLIKKYISHEQNGYTQGYI